MSDTVNVAGIDKGDLLAALFNNSRRQGMGFFQPGGASGMTKEQADQALRSGTDFDYLNGRVMKIDIGGDEVWPRLYDRDNGHGAVQRVVDSLRARQKAQPA